MEQWVRELHITQRVTRTLESGCPHTGFVSLHRFWAEAGAPQPFTSPLVSFLCIGLTGPQGPQGELLGHSHPWHSAEASPVTRVFPLLPSPSSKNGFRSFY